MRVGISLLTLLPGEVGGAETYARGLTRGLAAVGTLDKTQGSGLAFAQIYSP